MNLRINMIHSFEEFCNLITEHSKFDTDKYYRIYPNMIGQPTENKVGNTVDMQIFYTSDVFINKFKKPVSEIKNVMILDLEGKLYYSVKGEIQNIWDLKIIDSYDSKRGTITIQGNDKPVVTFSSIFKNNINVFLNDKPYLKYKIVKNSDGKYRIDDTENSKTIESGLSLPKVKAEVSELIAKYHN